MTERQEQMIYDEGRRRGFNDGYEACRDELAEKMMERIEEDGTLVIGVKDATKVTRVLVEDDKKNGDLYYADRPKGEWKITNTYKDHNGRVVDRVEHTDCGYIWHREMGEPLHNYCPNCGADMRGEDNE